MTASAQTSQVAGFDASRALFEALLGRLDGEGAGGMAHAELESLLDTEGRELQRVLLQDHLDLRAAREERIEEVAGCEGRSRGTVEAGTSGRLAACSAT